MSSPLGLNPKLNELMTLVAVSAATKSGNGYDLDVIKQEADRAAKLWEEHIAEKSRLKIVPADPIVFGRE